MTAPVRRFMDRILSSPLVRRLSGWVNGRCIRCPGISQYWSGTYYSSVPSP